jgi:hypothetical protein
MLWTNIRVGVQWPAFMQMSGVYSPESLLVTQPVQRDTIIYARFYSRSHDAVIRVDGTRTTSSKCTWQFERQILKRKRSATFVSALRSMFIVAPAEMASAELGKNQLKITNDRRE